jgi:4-hydroxybenzoate polyprenyltransferase
VSQQNIPLVVDLDGTLIKTDLLLESFYAMIKAKPLLIFRVPVWILKGKAHLKNQLAQHSHINVKTLPFHEEFLAYLRQEFNAGRKLILATASVEKFATAVAAHQGIFSAVYSTQNTLNLSGIHKRKLLVEKFGEKGFDYAGNGLPDLQIFPHARHAILVAPSEAVMKAAPKIASVQRIFDGPHPNVSVYIKTFRIHQWTKNLLLFVPMFTSHEWINPFAIWNIIWGIVAFSFCASSGYLLNDLIDLPADRLHPRKKLRPLPSGTLSIGEGTLLMIILLSAGLTLAAWLSPGFFLLLLLYCAVSIAYTFFLKTYVLIDVLVLAGLYTLRVVVGAILIDVVLSFWLFAFSIFIFFSLALIKRCSELVTLTNTAVHAAEGRDYRVADLAYLREMGIASGYLAIIIFALYINSPDVMVRYAHPKILWLICPILFYWISRLWLKTGRGEMHDDPIIYSIKDRGTKFVGLGILLTILLAI